MMCCDLIGEATECLQSEIDRQESGLCNSCPLANQLDGVEHAEAKLGERKELEEEAYEETLI